MTLGLNGILWIFLRATHIMFISLCAFSFLDSLQNFLCFWSSIFLGNLKIEKISQNFRNFFRDYTLRSSIGIEWYPLDFSTCHPYNVYFTMCVFFFVQKTHFIFDLLEKYENSKNNQNFWVGFFRDYTLRDGIGIEWYPLDFSTCHPYNVYFIMCVFFFDNPTY